MSGPFGSPFGGSSGGSSGGAPQLTSQPITASGATTSANVDSGNVITLTLEASTTLTISGSRTVDQCIVHAVQDGVGGRTLTMANARWAHGAAQAVSTAAAARDRLHCSTRDGWTTVDVAMLGAAMAEPA